MPDSKQVIGHQPDRGCQGKGRPNPKGMGNAPDHLPHHLWVAANPNNPGFIEVNLGLLNRCDFQEIKGGWVEKDKGNGRQDPDHPLDTRQILELPELHPVVAMVEKVDHHAQR